MLQRQCVILQGNSDWCRVASETLLAEYDVSQTIWLSDNAPEKALKASQKKAQSQLGKEFDAVIFDAIKAFNPDSFAAIVGTVKQGGVIIIWLEIVSQASLFMQRFKSVFFEFELRYDDFQLIQQNQAVGNLSVPIPSRSDNPVILTDDQQHAITAILKVVHGHRRRPLVLSADRGRGKSATLGIAAAQLLTEGKQTIIVTAPSLATVDIVFEHAERQLTDAETSQGLITKHNAEIRFIAPDILIQSEQKADLLLVDEAAAIPAPMLEKLLQKYSRIVFATTLHGYEGTGRGFTIRFQKTLTKTTPNWHHYKMKTPIRWAKDDILESFSFKSLLLDAEPVNEDSLHGVTVKECDFECIDQHTLLDSENDLRELFGLMVLAHYRTRPSDLQMMLDRDDMSLYIMRYQGQIIASAWLVKEGPLDSQLSADIYAGKRRLKGHLLPQSLLAHSGVSNAGGLKYQRVIRIVTHPAIQQQGIGKALLDNIVEQVDCDIVGSSFSINKEIVDFWLQAGFSAVRLGIHKDDVSGSHSIMMLKAKSPLGQGLLLCSIERFQQQWPHALHSQFKQLDPSIIIQLSQMFNLNINEISDWEHAEIHAFANEQRAYEFSQFALWNWLTQQVGKSPFLELDLKQQVVCIKSVLQQQTWPEIVKQCGFSGKGEAVHALRAAVRSLLALTH